MSAALDLIRIARTLQATNDVPDETWRMFIALAGEPLSRNHILLILAKFN